MKLHSYQRSKRIEMSAQTRFDIIYKDCFANLVNIKRIEERHLQLKGHDVHLLLKDDKKLIIDEKARTEDYGDILIEYLSNKQTGRKGWIYENESDYIAYLFPNNGCYFLKTKEIREWVENKQSEFWKFKDLPVDNKDKRRGIIYTTVSKLIPLKLLKELNLIKFIINKGGEKWHAV